MERRPPKRGQALLGAVIGAAVLLGGYLYFATGSGGSAHAAATVTATPAAPETTPAAPQPTPTTPSAPPATLSATAADGTVSCTWAPDSSGNPSLTKTGTPAAKGLPGKGTRDLTFTTSQGKITITLDVAHAPCSAASFSYLAGQKFFNGTSCHRLTTEGIYVLQCGDPTGTGGGGPSYTYGHENLPTAADNYPVGVVAVAIPADANGTPQIDANGSQFFIVYKDAGPGVLQSAYTVIGTVTAGMDVVQKVAKAGATTDPNDPNASKPKLPVNISTVFVGPVKS